MPRSNGQGEIGSYELDPRLGFGPPLRSGGQVAVMGGNLPPSRQILSEWRKVLPSGKTFASTPYVTQQTESLLSGISEVPFIRSDDLQIRGAKSGEAITLGVGSVVVSSFQGRITGPVKFINLLLDAWQLDSNSACILLGFESSDSGYIQNVLRGYATLRGRDAKDRIVHLFQIRTSLSALFQDDDVENEWLRERQQVLNEKTPMELLQEGSMENLLLVKEYVETVAGR